jgi:hypothetical protein
VYLVVDGLRDGLSACTVSNCNQCSITNYCSVCQQGYTPSGGVCVAQSCYSSNCVNCVLGSSFTCRTCQFGYTLTGSGSCGGFVPSPSPFPPLWGTGPVALGGFSLTTYPSMLNCQASINMGSYYYHFGPPTGKQCQQQQRAQFVEYNCYT